MQNRTMNRAIKFRGKRLDNGEWITGSPTLIQDADGVWLEDKDLDVVKVDPDTLGQYTGIKDKNDREIYEGDILRLSDKKSHEEEVVVEHGLYGWTFYNPQTDTFYSDGSHTYNAIENYRFMFGTGTVIGNIHDNAERLGRTISSAIRTALEQSIEPQTLVFEVGNQETDIAVELLPAELLLPQGRKYIPRKYDRGAFGILFERLLFAVRNGNIRDQLSLLANLDVFQRTLHRKTGTLVLSRTRFLEAVQHWLESEGLSLDTQVQDSYRRNSRHNSHAKVGTSYHS